MPLERRYFGSCIFIYIITNNPNFEPMCTAAVSAAEQGQFTLVTSLLTLVEVIKDRSGASIPPPRAQQLIAAYFEREHILMAQATREVMKRARDLRWKHGTGKLKTLDAVHLASALDTGCTTLYTYDGDMLSISEPGIRIEKPNIQAQTAFPLAQ
jgi:uncharacterized protein